MRCANRVVASRQEWHIGAMPLPAAFSEFARNFRAILDGGKRFLLFTHVRPDGDACGCLLAMGSALTAMGKEAVLWNEDGIPERYRWLPGSAGVLTGPLPEGAFDARIVLDTATAERVGKIRLDPQSHPPVINLDHHASNNGYGQLAFVDPDRASCGELVLELFKLAAMPLTRDAAQCLFVAISTDTGSFQYPNTTAATFRAAAELLETGLDLGEISRMTYESYPPRRLLLLREVLRSAKFDSGDRIGYFWIDAESYRRSGARPEDTEGVIDHIRAIQPVKVAVLFEELVGEGMVRMSFRSKDPRIDVNRVARQFGGGGHAAAAGARVAGAGAEVEKRVLDALRAALPV